MRGRLLSDMPVNILAAALPVLMLQLVLLPALNTTLDDAALYGLVLTSIAVLAAVPRTVGNSLNNVRLVSDSNYKKDSLSGDFNPIILGASVFAAVVSLGILIWQSPGTLDGRLAAAFLLAGFVYSAREYYIVAFRLELSFGKILLNSVFLIAGYCMGFAAFLATGNWALILVGGYGVSLAHTLIRGGLGREAWRFTPSFRSTGTKFVWLFVAALISSAITYADRLLLFPLLGGEAVTIYFVAALTAKMASMVATPIGGVLLSHLARRRSLNKRRLAYALLCATAVCLISYFGALWVSGPLIGVLYPEYAGEAGRYIPYTTAAAMLTMLLAVVNPFLVRFRNLAWQAGINCFVLTIYVFVAALLASAYGLMGFVVASVVVAALKVGFRLAILFLGKDESLLE